MNENCQKMPDKTEASTGRPSWFWPATYSRKLIHADYLNEMTERSEEAYHYDAFIKILANDPEFSNCKRADRNSNFKCEICLEIASNLEHLRRDHKTSGGYEKEIDAEVAKISSHMNCVNSQRAMYKRHQQMARDHPDRYLSLIVDGMDQSKLNLPCVSTRSDLRQQYGQYDLRLESSLWCPVVLFCLNLSAGLKGSESAH
jgi:hypothetical protein